MNAPVVGSNSGPLKYRVYILLFGFGDAAEFCEGTKVKCLYILFLRSCGCV